MKAFVRHGGEGSRRICALVIMEGADEEGSGFTGFTAKALAHHCWGIDVKVKIRSAGLDGGKKKSLCLSCLRGVRQPIGRDERLVYT